VIFDNSLDADFGKYFIKALKCFGQSSHLGQARNLQSLTIYLSEAGKREMKLIHCFVLLARREFLHVSTMRFCFPLDSVSRIARHNIMKSICDYCVLGDEDIMRLPPVSVLYGCLHDTDGFYWALENRPTTIVMEVTVYDG
jgi:hypothetical protein